MRSGVLVTMSAAVCLVFSAAAPALAERAVQVRFDLTDPQAGPFPADRFTVPDAAQLTGLRLDLPKPDCSIRSSDCAEIEVLNTLDGFNLQPRLSIPFTGLIDPATVSNETLFLFKLSCVICPGGSRVGVNEVVWDPATTTLFAESDKLLEQDARYLLVVTSGIRDTSGERIDADRFRDVLHAGQTNAPAETAYRRALLAALDRLKDAGMPPGQVAAASLFTAESATAVLEKIRDQLTQTTPAPADFLLGSNGERTVFALADLAGISWRRQDTTAPSFTTVSVPQAQPQSASIAARVESTRQANVANRQAQNNVALFTPWIDAYARHRRPFPRTQETSTSWALGRAWGDDHAGSRLDGDSADACESRKCLQAGNVYSRT